MNFLEINRILKTLAESRKELAAWSKDIAIQKERLKARKNSAYGNAIGISYRHQEKQAESLQQSGLS